MNCASLLTYLGRDLLIEDEDRPGAVLLSFLLLCAFPPEEQRALESVFGDQNLNDNKIFLTHCTLGVQGVPSGRELGWVELNLRSSLSWLAIQWIARLLLPREDGGTSQIHVSKSQSATRWDTLYRYERRWH